MTTVDYNFLTSKEYSHNGGWGNTNEYPTRASSSNIDKLTDSIFSFTEYNFLPCNGSKLDGHYTFFVNYKTFDYLLYKSSDYGSFTYTTESNDKSFTVLNDIDKKIVEAIIGSKLIGAYYYDSKEVNSKGKNLIQRNETGYNTKTSLITDYRGYVWSELKPNIKCSIERNACKLLDPLYIPLEVNDCRIVLNWNARSQQRFKVEYKDKEYKFSNIIVVNNIPFQYVTNKVVHNFIVIYQKTVGKVKKADFDLHLGYQIKNIESGEIFGNYTFNGIGVKDYINTLPSIICSKYH